MSRKYNHYNHCKTPNTTTSCDEVTKDSTCYSVIPSSCTKDTSCLSSSSSSSSSSCSADTFTTKDSKSCSYNTCTNTCNTCTNTCTNTDKSKCSTVDCETTKGHFIECDEKILGKKKFCVTFDHKKGHRFADEIKGDKTIHINGKNAPILKVKRGYVYYFSVEQKPHHGNYDNLFILTKSPVGLYEGQCPKPLPNSFDPVGNGCVKYFVNAKTPKYFYYQSTTHAFLGNLVIVE
jgi:hypothetical protein